MVEKRGTIDPAREEPGSAGDVEDGEEERPGGEASPVGEEAPGPDPGERSEPESEATEVALEKLRSELQSLTDRHLRLAAEFENYRRRSRTELAESGGRAQARLIAALLEALDDLGSVAALDPEVTPSASVLEGIGLVERKLFHTLEEAGLEEIDALGAPFDPNLMEAMARAPADSEQEDDTVDQVLQKGFRFGGQLVRPARVSVRKFE